MNDLSLPLAGIRYEAGIHYELIGSVQQEERAAYWSSTPYFSEARHLFFEE